MGNEHKLEKYYYISKTPVEQITSENWQQIQPTPK